MRSLNVIIHPHNRQKQPDPPDFDVTTAAGTDFHLAAARGPKGEVWLTWQAFRNGNSDIHPGK